MAPSGDDSAAGGGEGASAALGVGFFALGVACKGRSAMRGVRAALHTLACCLPAADDVMSNVPCAKLHLSPSAQ